MIYYTDSRVLYFWHHYGTANGAVADLLRQVKQICVRNDIILEVSWRPRTDGRIQLADTACRTSTDECRNEQEITFSTTDLTLEGALREAGAQFRPQIKTNNINELNIRKFILRCLYGKSFKQPYNENLAEFRTGLRCLTSLHTLSRCEDYRVLKKSDIKFENGDVDLQKADFFMAFLAKRENSLENLDGIILKCL